MIESGLFCLLEERDDDQEISFFFFALLACFEIEMGTVPAKAAGSCRNSDFCSALWVSKTLTQMGSAGWFWHEHVDKLHVPHVLDLIWSCPRFFLGGIYSDAWLNSGEFFFLAVEQHVQWELAKR